MGKRTTSYYLPALCMGGLSQSNQYGLGLKSKVAHRKEHKQTFATNGI